MDAFTNLVPFQAARSSLLLAVIAKAVARSSEPSNYVSFR